MFGFSEPAGQRNGGELLASIFYQPLENIGAIAMAIMMAGAVLMHIKIKDALKCSLMFFFI